MPENRLAPTSPDATLLTGPHKSGRKLRPARPCAIRFAVCRSSNSPQRVKPSHAVALPDLLDLAESRHSTPQLRQPWMPHHGGGLIAGVSASKPSSARRPTTITTSAMRHAIPANNSPIHCKQIRNASTIVRDGPDLASSSPAMLVEPQFVSVDHQFEPGAVRPHARFRFRAAHVGVPALGNLKLAQVHRVEFKSTSHSLDC